MTTQPIVTETDRFAEYGDKLDGFTWGVHGGDTWPMFWDLSEEMRESLGLVETNDANGAKYDDLLHGLIFNASKKTQISSITKPTRGVSRDATRRITIHRMTDTAVQLRCYDDHHMSSYDDRDISQVFVGSDCLVRVQHEAQKMAAEVAQLSPKLSDVSSPTEQRVPVSEQVANRPIFEMPVLHAADFEFNA